MNKKFKKIFKATSYKDILEQIAAFPHVEKETVPLENCLDRVLAEDIESDIDLPDFKRSTVDGYAVQSNSTLDASRSVPACLNVVGTVAMSMPPDISVTPGNAARIPTGGMLPDGCDSVVMTEHTQLLDQATIEVLKSCIPLQNVTEIGEDVGKGRQVLTKGKRIKPPEMGLFAALGISMVPVFKQPVVAVISSGDEIVPVNTEPHLAQLRDVNGYLLMGMVRKAGGIPLYMGIVRDDFEEIFQRCRKALLQAEVVVLSGGCSIGTGDFSLEVIKAFPHSQLFAYGVSINPGKPTILGKIGTKAFWGLPGRTAAAMLTFFVMVRPLIEKMSGLSLEYRDTLHRLPAILCQNIGSARGRIDFICVKITHDSDQTYAHPILGKSKSIHTMVETDGIIKVDIDSEGLDSGTEVEVIML
ncbi:MAG: molybdopterin molybdotransferase MoeA [Desulfobacterales bacterium]|jgi:molybdopterin molybdotransferase|nr:molybdopterin molybdenumtransferase MoeA [Desulfobacter sp.]MDP6681985.1 molybdopterin molybdotransferase MoeA [Desulfobacterales bacterium]MDP6808239.1 molybdopterin molybdotransferase MoeA [Desulfobacterales bacterium]|tara:strand:- start:394 stop:1638 length:1245 start_codon:yes stop_codon:yes gene_type:complete